MATYQERPLTLRRQRLAQVLPTAKTKLEAGRLAGLQGPDATVIHNVNIAAKNSQFQAAMEQHIQSAAEKLGLTPEYVLGGLMDNHQRAMQAVPVLDAKGNPTGEYTYQGQVANRALELLGKHLRILGDEAPKGGDTYNQVVLQGYTVEQLRSLLQGMQQGSALPPPTPSVSDDTPLSGA